ncbi:MAG: CotH kinase family protein [Bacteroidetes bacterium]|nr:CotH kinase family protein [Bacteroidota bacterium]
MKTLLLIISISFTTFLYDGSISAQSFYSVDTIQNIEINFSQSDWDYQMDTAKSGNEGYIIAEWCKVNGVKFDSVGVKYKGSSSYNANNGKNPLHIELDYIKGKQNYQGFTDIKLGNGYTDPSMIREVLSYEILKNYMHCPQANFAQVYINSKLIGLYSNAESINKHFVGNHFYSSENTLIKCNPANAGPNSPTSNLTYKGVDSTNYYSSYELKSKYGWNDLIMLCDTLANNPGGINKIIDVDRALWMLAFNNVLVNLDSYTGALTQNYYLYKDRNKRFNPVIWDLNMCFGSFTMPDVFFTPIFSVSDEQTMSPTLHETNANRPLIQKLLAKPMYRKMYIAHMRTITNEFFVNDLYQDKAKKLMAIIDTAVKSDTTKFFTYAQFQSSLTTDMPAGFMTTPGIVNLMSKRTQYLVGTAEFKKIPPTISNIVTSPLSPTFNSLVSITANITNTNANSVYLGYRYNIADIFTRILMYDDGLHNDGAANDNNFGVSIPVLSAQVQYYIYSENNDAGMFSPERAEHNYYTINATVQAVSVGDLVINEFMAINLSTSKNSNGQYADWIELYNTTNNPINLGTLYLSDDYNNKLKWSMPVNATINPLSYIIIWADEDTIQNGLHSNFKLAGGGEQLILSYASGKVLDSITYSTQIADISFGRYPNGTGSFTAMMPTFAAENSLGLSIEEPGIYDNFNLYPNPSSGTVYVVSNQKEDEITVKIFNSVGQQVFFKQNSNDSQMELNLTELKNGIYSMRVNNSFCKKLVIIR